MKEEVQDETTLQMLREMSAKNVIVIGKTGACDKWGPHIHIAELTNIAVYQSWLDWKRFGGRNG